MWWGRCAVLLSPSLDSFYFFYFFRNSSSSYWLWFPLVNANYLGDIFVGDGLADITFAWQ